MESNIDYLKRKLREAESAEWESIAKACGVSEHLPRKIVYGERDNLGAKKMQPLLDYFRTSELATKRPRRPAKAEV